MYQCKWFKIFELVPPFVYLARGDKAWQLLDARACATLDRLRERYGPATVNNYYWGGDRKWSGLRTPASPYYRPYSQHTFGRACDMVFRSATAEEVRRDILGNPDHPDFAYINSVELGVSWLHFDVRNCDRVMVYSP